MSRGTAGAHTPERRVRYRERHGVPTIHWPGARGRMVSGVPAGSYPPRRRCVWILATRRLRTTSRRGTSAVASRSRCLPHPATPRRRRLRDARAAAARLPCESSPRAQEYACVVIGGGIRKPEPMLEFFETVINLVRRHAPSAAIAFNTNPETTLEAARRWLPAPDADVT